MKLAIGLKGKPVLNQIIKVLNLTTGWNLSYGQIEVIVELLYRNYELSNKGISDYSDRMNILFSKKSKEDISNKLSISYNALANTLSKLRKTMLGKTGLITDNKLNVYLCSINPYKENLELKILFNPNNNG